MAAAEVGITLFPITLGEVDNNNISRSVTQTMLSDLAALLTFNRLAADRLFFFGAYSPGGQLAEHNFIYEDVANNFFEDAEDNLAGYHQVLDIIQYIGFSGERILVDADNAFLTLATDNLVRRAYQRDADDAFGWKNHDDRSVTDFTNYALLRAYNASNSMLTDIVRGGDFQDVYQFFEALDSTIDASGTEYGRGPSHSVIQDHVAFKITGGPTCPEKEFTPFVGSSGDTSYGSIDESTPSLSSNTLTLTYPYSTPTLTLTLKNPEFGDQDVLSFAKIDRTTRGGDRKIYAANKWGETQRLQLTVSNLLACNVAVADIVTFLNSSLGKEVGLRDWHNRQWRGVIVTPDTEIEQEVTGTRVTITFEGVQV